MAANGSKVSSWDDEDVLQLSVMMVAQLCEYGKTTDSRTLNWRIIQYVTLLIK